MGTLKETAYSIATKLNRAIDFEFIETVKFDILTMVATLARREYERTRKFPDELITKLACVPIKEVPSDECCDVDLGCNILRTINKIPSAINVKDSTNFISVSGSGNNKLPYVTYARIGNTDSKFGNFPFYTFYNNYIYIFNTIKIEYISIVAAFVDKRQLKNVKDCAGLSCFDESNEVNIPDHYIPVITDSLLQKYNPQYKSQEVEISKNE